MLIQSIRWWFRNPRKLLSIGMSLVICLLLYVAGRYEFDPGIMYGGNYKIPDYRVSTLIRLKRVGEAIHKVAQRNSNMWPQSVNQDVLKHYLPSPDYLRGFVYVRPRQLKVEDTPPRNVLGYSWYRGERGVSYG